MATATELKSKLAALQSALEDYIANDDNDELTDEERQILERFRALPKDTQAAFKNLLENVAEKLSAQNFCDNEDATDDDDSSTDGLPKIGTPLNNCTWEQISAVSKAGLGEKYFNIGDCKEITLNGKIGGWLTLENEKLSVFILHFNYPINGKPDKNIIWGGFKTSDGTDVALCDNKYMKGFTDGTICFNMNHWGNVNYGGWKGCDLRYDILGATSLAPSQYNRIKAKNNVGYDATAETLTNPKENTLLAALPADFRNVLRLWSRWIDAKGNRSNVEANIEETIDAVTLLAEFEVYGSRTLANECEQNHQTQMAYYKNGNDKIKNNNSLMSSVYWWSSSPHYFNYSTFCNVSTDGLESNRNAHASFGVAPAFMS